MSEDGNPSLVGASSVTEFDTELREDAALRACRPEVISPFSMQGDFGPVHLPKELTNAYPSAMVDAVPWGDQCG